MNKYDIGILVQQLEAFKSDLSFLDQINLMPGKFIWEIDNKNKLCVPNNWHLEKIENKVYATHKNLTLIYNHVI